MHPASPSTVCFQSCDFKDPIHQKAFLLLVDAYMADPMGAAPPLNKEQKRRMLSDLAGHPSTMATFLLYKGIYAGLTVAFINYSTFRAAPYLNIHDLIIDSRYRNKHLGRQLMNHLIARARELNYCKITLEVRHDNLKAKQLYQSLGFTECGAPMHFWQKLL